MDKILLIEDDLALRETIEELLCIYDYEVETAVNGSDGFDKLSQFNHDLVLCDINMPDCTGFELLKKIKIEFSGITLPPVIFLSAHVETNHIKKATSLGAVGYVTKPFDISLLIKTIKEHIDKNRAISD